MKFTVEEQDLVRATRGSVRTCIVATAIERATGLTVTQMGGVTVSLGYMEAMLGEAAVMLEEAWDTGDYEALGSYLPATLEFGYV